MYSLLSPLGEYRSQQIVPSQGKRERKRKRKEQNAAPALEQASFPKDRSHDAEVSEPPELQKHITIGFNSTTRYLEFSAQIPSSSTTQSQNRTSTQIDAPIKPSSNSDKPRPMAAVFVSRSDQLSILYSHFPLLVKTASLASPYSPAPRLISLPKGAEQRLSAALSIPRVGIIGVIEGAPNADFLIGFVRKQVPEVEVPWLHEASTGAYMPLNIKAIQTTIPANLEKSKPLQAAACLEDD